MNQQIPEGLDLALLEVIPCGRVNARTGRELVRIIKQRYPHISLPQSDPGRLIREVIHVMRTDGVPISADTSNGYYLAIGYRELLEYYKQLVKRARELWLVIRGLKQTLKHLQAYELGQQTYDETGREQAPFAHISERYRPIVLRRIREANRQTANANARAQQNIRDASAGESKDAPQTNLVINDQLRPLLDEAVRAAIRRMKPYISLELFAAYAYSYLLRLVQEQLHHPLPLSYLKQCKIDKHTLKDYLAPIYNRRLQALRAQRSLIEED